MTKDAILTRSDVNEKHWYDLFSRGTRDWLRHNDKIRDAVKKSLPNLVAGADIITRPSSRTMQVPVRFLEHYRFRLRDPEEKSGAGQGKGKPGDILAPAQGQGSGKGAGGGNDQGGVEFVFEFQTDEIVDWIWEELKLPNLKPKIADTIKEDEYVREGWDKRGARSRLDRRRTMKEAIKRRHVQHHSGPQFSDDDLRFRQIAPRPRPSTHAAVVFAMDVSSSMGADERMLAKSFFFWALQGLKRQYNHIETVFVAHTIEAWEFNEEDFFRVQGQGGTVASSAFSLTTNILEERFSPSHYNNYVFYASDGENFVEDRIQASSALTRITELSSFTGYVEIAPHFHASSGMYSETGRIFHNLSVAGQHVDSAVLARPEDVWEAIRRFFQHDAVEEV